MSQHDKNFPGPDDFEIISRETVHDGFMQLDRLELKHRLFEGGWSRPMPRELLRKAQAIGILLFDPDADAVVMVRQFRTGVIDSDASPWLLELVAGMVDADEAPEEVARRECKEEANCEPADLVKVTEYYNSPGTSNEHLVIFCGRVDAATAGGIFGLDEEHEDIRVEVLAYDDAVAATLDGRINNAMSLIALQWLQINKSRLIERWRT